jgi:hypothetical protein
MCHVWTAPGWQGLSSRRVAARCRLPLVDVDVVDRWADWTAVSVRMPVLDRRFRRLAAAGRRVCPLATPETARPRGERSTIARRIRFSGEGWGQGRPDPLGGFFAAAGLGLDSGAAIYEQEGQRPRNTKQTNSATYQSDHDRIINARALYPAFLRHQDVNSPRPSDDHYDARNRDHIGKDSS